MAAHNHIWRGRTPGLTGWAPGCPACPPPVTPRGMPPHPSRRHSGRTWPARSPHAPEPGIPPRSDDGDRTRPPPLPAPDCPLSSRPHPRKGCWSFPPPRSSGRRSRSRDLVFSAAEFTGIWNQWADPRQDLSCRRDNRAQVSASGRVCVNVENFTDRAALYPSRRVARATPDLAINYHAIFQNMSKIANA